MQPYISPQDYEGRSEKFFRDPSSARNGPVVRAWKPLTMCTIVWEEEWKDKKTKYGKERDVMTESDGDPCHLSLKKGRAYWHEPLQWFVSSAFAGVISVVELKYLPLFPSLRINVNHTTLKALGKMFRQQNCELSASRGEQVQSSPTGTSKPKRQSKGEQNMRHTTSSVISFSVIEIINS